MIFNLSSDNAINGNYKSSVNVQLPSIDTNYNIKNIYFSVLHAEVPNSFYIVNYTCNTITIDNITYTIPVGNYNALNLITAIKLLIPSNFQISYSSVTNKYTITNSTADFTINTTNSTIKNVMGLGSSNLSSTSKTVVCPNCVNFLPIQRLTFRSDFFNFGNYSTTDKNSDMFLSLQNNAGQQGVIQYNNNGTTEFQLEHPKLENINIRLTDDYGNLLNLNGVNWYLTFLIKIEYEIPQKLDFNETLSILNQLI